MRGLAKILGCFLLCVSGAHALDYEDGRIKLVIDKTNGRFSLYYMTDVDKKRFEPLFWDRDKRTSFFSVYMNGSEYRMGENSRFRTYLRGTDTKPVVVFESPMLAVTMEFSFIRTASSGVSNGIRIDMKMENWDNKTVEAGMRLLVDTFLGEAQNPNFRTNLRPVPSELIIDPSSRDQWWVSRNKQYGMMGSIFVEGIDSPSYLHFANWKRLYSATYKPEYVPTRNFNEMPFSVRDSAVCYYLDVRPLEKWGNRSFTVLLAADDQYGFDIDKIRQPPPVERLNIVTPQPEIPPRQDPQRQDPLQVVPGTTVVPETNMPNTNIVTVTPQAAAPSVIRRGTMLLPVGPIRVDLMTLRELIYKVDEYIYFGTAISEEELRGMELTITRLKSRYGGMLSPFR